jgi:ATP-dependent Clp protease adaptor protein ClpS
MDKEILVNAPSLEAPWLVAVMASGRTTIVAESVITAPPPVIDPEIDTEVAPDLISERTPVDHTAPLYKVLIHNDDVTPLDYVIRILRRVFMLSHELAEHIAETAHHEEVAIVVIRPRTEAEKLTGAARLQARADGYPLTFSMEPDE